MTTKRKRRARAKPRSKSIAKRTIARDQDLSELTAAIVADVAQVIPSVSCLRHYSKWVSKLTDLNPHANERVFVELSKLAQRYMAVGEEELGRTLAALAKIGLNPIVDGVRPMNEAPRASETME